ncbi:IclR family transcriptional regulator [Pseudactinotalea sp. Z1739]|uniref:IclR family transcriptional regulator n=1 Tax=Pseudactinotalea sp. Z1739 TaxID=3413028 RepID=UPI003C7BC5C1
MSRPAEQDDNSSLTKGLSLLSVFTVAEDELSMSEMARVSGIPKSTTHRLVSDLVRWGALERGPGGYRLGVKLFELGHLVPAQRTLRELAVPYAHNLTEVTNLTSNLAVREDREILYLEKISRQDLTVPHSRAGGRLPLHCTGLGKAILAFSEYAFIESVLAHPLRRMSGGTITKPDQLRRELAKIRKTQVAYDVEESQPGLFCVAAPIMGLAGQPVGAISVTGATALAQARKYASAVRTTAMAISRVLTAQTTRRPA